jgi:transposase InsO family protein
MGQLRLYILCRGTAGMVATGYVAASGTFQSVVHVAVDDDTMSFLSWDPTSDGATITASCSSSGLRSRSPASPSTSSNGGGPSSQGWRTFVRNHAPDIAAMDLLVVPAIGFDLLYAFVIVWLNRRDLVWINVTTNPNAEWIARQVTEAFPWNEAPRHMIRDRDRIYGAVVTRRLRAISIRDKPIAPVSPWQNGFVERLIGSIRRECVDHVIVLGEMHLRRVLKSYADYNCVRTHRSLNKDAPVSRPVQRTGVISSRAILGGLHHRYARA